MEKVGKVLLNYTSQVNREIYSQHGVGWVWLMTSLICACAICGKKGQIRISVLITLVFFHGHVHWKETLVYNRTVSHVLACYGEIKSILNTCQLTTEMQLYHSKVFCHSEIWWPIKTIYLATGMCVFFLAAILKPLWFSKIGK